uniref:Methanethiol oxidase n=1 Tax=Dunaliella viridis TaxID=140095 RepID=A7UCI4_9CHLO|nr:selenium binding protein [Dunaliella viridis]
MSCCGFYPDPKAAVRGPRETLLYVPAIVPDASRPDYLCTVDVNPESKTYCSVIHRCPVPHKGDELHHSGWNACSSCFGESGRTRSMIVLPGLKSGRVYGFDTLTDPRAPRLAKMFEGLKDLNLSTPHTTHCLPSGEIMISCLGDAEGNARGNFLLLDQDLKSRGLWGKQDVPWGYDFWYQPKLNVMISTSWGEPKELMNGFNPAKANESYGRSLFIWDWEKHTITQELDVGAEGAIPLELRFLHDPEQPHAYVGSALGSSLIHITRDDTTGKWKHRVAVQQEPLSVEGWVLPAVPPLITDIIISMDDRFLYWSNWLRGDIVQCDISDPHNPKIVGRVWLGGCVRKGGPIKVLGGLPDGLQDLPEIPKVRGHELLGGPQMIQLSLDGKRLYVTNSLFSVWDKQFYPPMADKGSYMLQIDVDTGKGGLCINPDFYVDFGAEPDGPVLAPEMRYPGGDCSSDIFLSK